MSQENLAGLDNFRASHASLLAWLHAQSNSSRWSVSREDFSVTLYRSVTRHFSGSPPSGDALEIFLRGLHVEDLALACALRTGSDSAWEEFVARYRPILYSAARAIVGTAGEARARELADSLYADLYGVKTAAGEPRRPLLDHFGGRSKLSTWLRAVLAQRHVDTLRAAIRTESLSEDGAEETAAATLVAIDHRAANPGAGAAATAPLDGDPDRHKLLPRLQGAVSEALAALVPADRLLLSLYYVQGLTLAQIAALRGFHEATASRHLARIARQLRESVERTLLTGAPIPVGTPAQSSGFAQEVAPGKNGCGAQAALSLAQVELCFTYALEDWPLDLRRELQAAAETASEQEPQRVQRRLQPGVQQNEA